MTDTIGSFEMIHESSADTGISQYKVLPVDKTGKNPNGIWNYYGIAQKENNTLSESKNRSGDRFLCLLCFQKGKVQLYKKSTSSGNMWRHISRKHGVIIPKSCSAIFKVHTSISSDTYPNHLSDETTMDDEEFDIVMGDEDDEPHQTVNNISASKCHDEFKDIGSLLITEIAKHPPLYEFSPSRSPGKKELREKLWSEVHENLDIMLDVKKLQQMWKNIRDRYRKLRNLQKQDGGATDPTTKYKYYNQLQFLDSELAKSDQLGIDDYTTDAYSLNEPPKKKDRSDELSLIIEDKNIDSFIISEIQSDSQNHFDDVTQSTIEDSFGIMNGNCSSNNVQEHLETNKYIRETSSPCNDTDYKVTIPITTLGNNTTTTTNTSTENGQYANYNIQETSLQLPQIQQHNLIDNHYKLDELELFGRFIAEKIRNIPKTKWDNLQIKILQLIKTEE